jgi:hypothetical protein
MAEAGWYDDPHAAGQQRYFDGERWTDQRRSTAPTVEERDGWQYQIIDLGLFSAAERMTSAFGVLGSEGWELITVFDKSSNWIAGGEKGFAIFKRRVPAGIEPEEPWARWRRAGEITSPEEQARIEALGPNATHACKDGLHGQCKRRWCTCRCHHKA